MVRVKSQPQTPATPTETGFKGGGRPHAAGTVLARVMTERRIKVHQIGGVLHVSDRCVHNYLIRKRPIPVLHLGALCDYLDMDPDEIVDAGNLLLEDGT